MDNEHGASLWTRLPRKKLAYICSAVIAAILVSTFALIIWDHIAEREESPEAEPPHFLWEAAGTDLASEMKESGSDEETNTGAISEALQLAYYDGQKARILALSDEELWQQFDDAVLIGDSRVEGFKLYTSVPQSHVLSKNGATVLHMDSVISSAAYIEPSRIYIAYGINDIKAGLGTDAQGYASLVEEKINVLRDALPDARINVNSILPASAGRTASDRDYQKVPAYNEALMQMCERRGWTFIDNSEIAQEYSSLYVSDGIHLTAGFYRFWGQNMLLAGIEGEQDDGENRIDGR